MSRQAPALFDQFSPPLPFSPAQQQSRKRALDLAPANALQSINSGNRPMLQRPRMDGPQSSTAGNGQQAGTGQQAFFQAAPPDVSRPLLNAPALNNNNNPQFGGMSAGPMTLSNPGPMMAGSGAQGGSRACIWRMCVLDHRASLGAHDVSGGWMLLRQCCTAPT